MSPVKEQWNTVVCTLLITLLFALIGCTGSPSAEIKARAAELSSGFRQHAETLAAKQDESLTILRENTTALAAIKSQVEAVKTAIETQEPRREVVESSPPEVASELSAASTSRSSDVPLFVSYADFHCPPCERLREAIQRGDFAGFAVIESGPFAGQKAFPAVRYQDRNGTWKVRYGYDARLPQWIRSDIESIEQFVSQPVITNPIVSQESLVSIHNQLHGGGNWTWPGGTQESLATHLREVHGVNTSGGAPLTGAMFQNHRPSAITSQRTAVRFVPRRVSYNSRSKYQTRQSCPTCPR
jgi:hypothetical protein